MRPSRLLPLIIATALFMENTDSTVISTSLPAIAARSGEDPIALKLALTSYLVGLAIFIPVSRLDGRPLRRAHRLPAAHRGVHGRLARLRRPRTRSAASSLARFVQGMGGAMMVPVGRLVLLRSVPKNEVVAGAGLG